ncbi:hypothetical protein EPN29_00130 [bacterium]|nr:MAG: hypothetical protein EPN29_00130 [bacterium]
MAVQPPPAPVATQQALPPGAPPKSGCSGRGCGCGCLVALLLVLLLGGGGGYYFLVVRAQAGVPAPAALVIFSPAVDVGDHDSNYRAGVAGQQLNAGNSVRSDQHGHAAIQFPDGSYVRLSPGTTVTVTAAQLKQDGTLQSAGVVQKVGRTFSNVQHLVGGASFQVGGHSVSASVRGTQFEVLVRADHSNLIKVFDGTVTVSGATTATIHAGQQIEADANGKLSNPRPIQPEVRDPFALSTQCTQAALAGNNAGTVQTASGDNLTTGQTAESDYNSPGGDLSLAFCYPGSLMSVMVTDANGRAHFKQGPPPIVLKIANGPPGLYRAIVRALNLPSGGEPYSISFATDAGCAAGNVDSGTVVRQTLSNAEIAQALQRSGATGVTLQVLGTSATSARIHYHSNLGGVPLAWTVVFYAATPNLGAVISQVAVQGINVTTEVVSRLTSAAARPSPRSPPTSSSTGSTPATARAGT